ncbi:MAG: hypothetical protein SXG53_28040, partial [Pseudomonadota bacterium]|nr:hypothetical protein [Pseudomonadota bacterium]
LFARLENFYWMGLFVPAYGVGLAFAPRALTDLATAVRRSAISAGAIHVDRWERWALAQADRVDPVLSGQVLKHLHVPELDDLVEAT